jgi:hypothetical protein
MKKQVNEELTRIRQMITSIIKEDFEFPSSNDNDSVVDCESSILDLDTMEIVVMYEDDDKYETYLVSVEFDYEDSEDQTYDYPGSAGGASGDVDGIMMTHPEKRELTPKEVNDLLSNDVVSKCIYSAIEDMEVSAFENYSDSGPDPDDDYERSRDSDYE